MNIFIVHYKKLTNRRQYLEYALKNKGIIHFIDYIDRDTLSDYQKNLYKEDTIEWDKKINLWYNIKNPSRKLSLSEVACFNTHIEIYKIIIDKKLDYAIVLEDDAILLDNFSNINNIIKELPNDFDLCYFDDSFNWKPYDYNPIGHKYIKKHIKSDKNIYKMISNKCAAGYIISNKCAYKIINNLKNFCMPIDWEQMYWIYIYSLNVYWTDVFYTHQGSFDVYKSEADRREESSTNNIKTFIDNYDNNNNFKQYIKLYNITDMNNINMKTNNNIVNI